MNLIMQTFKIAKLETDRVCYIILKDVPPYPWTPLVLNSGEIREFDTLEEAGKYLHQQEPVLGRPFKVNFVRGSSGL